MNDRTLQQTGQPEPAVSIKIMDWSEPANFKSWVKRMFAPQALALMLLISLGFITELRFDWAEHLVGGYLVSTNSFRPRSGAVWETSRRSTTARETLDKIVTDRQASQREARNAASFAQIAGSFSASRGIMLSADHFRTLYLRLPADLAEKIVSPFDLIQQLNTGTWVRTYMEKAGDGLDIYLLNKQNRVLQSLTISREILETIERHENAANNSLTDLPGFENRIYPAKRFFTACAALPEDVRKSIILDPEKILGTPGRVVRVGISDEIKAGTIELGFEIKKGGHYKVVLLQGQDWAIWRLRTLLEETGAETDAQGTTLP